jgi:hypothetical protein
VGRHVVGGAWWRVVRYESVSKRLLTSLGFFFPTILAAVAARVLVGLQTSTQPSVKTYTQTKEKEKEKEAISYCYHTQAL